MQRCNKKRNFCARVAVNSVVETDKTENEMHICVFLQCRIDQNKPKNEPHENSLALDIQVSEAQLVTDQVCLRHIDLV